ncbi:hypothetical protein VTO73DRAFT_10885 [Trametes versicolor]
METMVCQRDTARRDARTHQLAVGTVRFAERHAAVRDDAGPRTLRGRVPNAFYVVDCVCYTDTDAVQSASRSWDSALHEALRKGSNADSYPESSLLPEMARGVERDLVSGRAWHPRGGPGRAMEGRWGAGCSVAVDSS